MVMEIFRRRSNVSSTENAGEISRTQAAIAGLEREIAEAGAALEAGEERRAALRYQRDVAGDDIGDGIAAVDAQAEVLAGKKAALVTDLGRRRHYLVTLQQPFLEAQERELAAELAAIRDRQDVVIKAEAEALTAWFLARAEALDWQREGGGKTSRLNSLRRQLGLPDVNAPVLPSGSRLRPAPLLSGTSDRPGDYRAAAARLRAAIDASDAAKAAAWRTETRERTVAQNDLIVLWPLGAS